MHTHFEGRQRGQAVFKVHDDSEVSSSSPYPARSRLVYIIFRPAFLPVGFVNPYTLGEVPSSSPLPAGHADGI